MLKKTIGVVMILIAIASFVSIEHILDLGLNGFVSFMLFMVASTAACAFGFVGFKQFESKTA